MFARFRKPTPKKRSYLLHLTPLESRDVPATWHVTMLSSNPGSTDATITESLVVGTASVTAPTANDAIALAIAGNVNVTYGGQTHTYTFNPTSTSGTGPAFRIVGSGSNTELQLEDLADMPGATPDYDYNDYTWSLNVAQTAANGDPLPEVGIEAIDPTAAEAKSPPGTSTGLFRVSRSGSTTDALTTYVRIVTNASSATNKDDYSELALNAVTYMTGGGSVTENLYPVTFAPNETYVTIPIVPVDDIMPESTESVQLRVVGIDSKYTASTNKYAVAEVLIADNDPFLAPVQKVYFGDGDLVAQSGSNGGMYVIKRTVADSYLTVNYTVSSTASEYTLGGGYGGNTSATFLPGISEVSVNLTMNTYGPSPASGPVTLTITPSSNYEILGSPSNTVEIYSTGGPGPWINVFRRVDPVGNTLNEGGDKGQFVVSRYYAYPTGQPPQTIPPPPPFPDFALGGTARQGLDYTATKQATSVILPALGSSMVYVDGYEVEIAPLADGVYDNGEWVDFALIPNEQSIVPSSSKGVISVTLPISDPGTPPKPQISIVAPDPNSSELATSSGMYRILRNDVNLPQSLTINYAFDPTGLTDPATFNDDYTATSGVGGLASSGSLTFPAGVAMIEVKLTPVDDNKLENDELAQLKLLPGSAYIVDATKAQALVLIVDKELKPTGDLDIIDSKGDEVAEDKEENPGGWVSVNNDNDNYNFKGSQKYSVVHELDKDENAKIVGENDLIKITVRDLVVPAGMVGKFTLEWSSAKIKIWKTSDKDGAVVSGAEVTAGQVSNYWVEGLELSSSMAAEQIALTWTDAAANAVPQAIDKVNFTVYEVTGAMNVPGHSIYTYQARTPFGSNQAGLGALSGGTTMHSTYDDSGIPYLTTTARIRWDGGPIVGRYRVTPGANENFFVDREVNVVEIQILPAGNTKEATYSPSPGIAQDAVGNASLYSNPEVAMAAKLTIANIQGPLIGDVRRGARFMEIGFNHQAQFFAMQGRYDTVGKTIRSNLVDGEVHWDSGNMQEIPWANLDVHFTTLGDATVTELKFKTADGPRINATDPTKFTYLGDQVDRLTVDMKHQVYFSAKTREESVNGSGAVLTQRAKLNWRWHADGIVGDGVIVVNNVVVPNGTWVQSGTGVTGDAFFTRVTNGDVVPDAKSNINEPLQGLQGGVVWNVI